MTGWLLTWEWIGDHAKKDKPFITVLNYRRSSEYVRKFVEQLYAIYYYSDQEILALARNKENNPYPAEFNAIKGVTWAEQITCGHNPFIFARLVDDLKFETDQEGNEVLKWDERPPPKLPNELFNSGE